MYNGQCSAKAHHDWLPVPLTKLLSALNQSMKYRLLWTRSGIEELSPLTRIRAPKSADKPYHRRFVTITGEPSSDNRVARRPPLLVTIFHVDLNISCTFVASNARFDGGFRGYIRQS